MRGVGLLERFNAATTLCERYRQLVVFEGPLAYWRQLFLMTVRSWRRRTLRARAAILGDFLHLF